MSQSSSSRKRRTPISPRLGIIAGLVVVSLVLVGIGASIILNNFNERMAGEGASAVAANLAGTEAMRAAPVQPTQATAPPATIIPSPTAIPAQPMAGENGEAGFDVQIEDGLILAADGYSTATVTVATTHASLEGQFVSFTVEGGGAIFPTTALLPPVGETLTLIYTAGSASSDIHITGHAGNDLAPLIDYAALTLQLDLLRLEATYLLPVAGNPIPVTFHLASTIAGEPVRGQYEIYVRTTGGTGSVSVASGGFSDATIITASDQDGDGTAESYVSVMPSGAAPVTLSAQVLGRGDMASYEKTLYWQPDVQKLAFNGLRQPDALPLYRTTPELDRRYLWDWQKEEGAQYLCVDAYDQWGIQTLPTIITFSYESLLTIGAPPALFMNTIPVFPGQLISSDRTYSDRALIFPDTPSCAVLTGGTQTGLLRIHSAGGAANSAQDTALAIGYYGRLWDISNRAFSVLAGDTTLPFIIDPNMIPAIFLLESPDANRSQTVLYSLWLPSASVAVATNTLHPAPGETTIPVVTDLASYEAGYAPSYLAIKSVTPANIWPLILDGIQITNQTTRRGEESVEHWVRVYALGRMDSLN